MRGCNLKSMVAAALAAWAIFMPAGSVQAEGPFPAQDPDATSERPSMCRRRPAPPPSTASLPGLQAELRALVAQGRRDQAASPEFLDALERLANRPAGNRERAAEPPSDRLPFRPGFEEPGMPAGWAAVEPSAWRFGNGEAVQTFGRANTRYVLFYEPGMVWRDYKVTFCFESDAWFPPPANSCAALYLRYRNPDDCYNLEWDGKGTLTLKNCVAGAKTIVARLPVDTAVIRDGQPWTVCVKGDGITVDHLGTRYIECHDSTHPSGTIGLESIHIPMHFRSLEVLPY